MGVHRGSQLKKTASLAIVTLALSGCASVETGQAVKPGDRVGVRFDCRMPGGDIAVSTRTDAGKGEGEHISPLFLPRETSAQVILNAGTPDPLSPTMIRPMEEDVLQQLRGVVLTMKKGESRNVELRASRLPDRKPADGIVKYNRVRHYAKVERISPAAYKQATGKDPALGDSCTAFREAEFEGVVAAIKDDEVVIRYSVAPGAKVRDFFGSGTITDAGDEFVASIDAEEGKLVRSGYLSGKIVKVTSQSVHIDFTDQFVGEALNCSVTVDSVSPGTPAPTGTKGGAPEAGGNQEAFDKIKKAMNDAALHNSSTATIDLDDNGKITAGAPDRIKATDNSASQNSSAAVDPDVNGKIAAGDLVRVNYAASLEDGTLLGATQEKVANDPARKKAAWFKTPERFLPAELIAGKEELVPGLADALTGMGPGEKKHLVVPPEKGYGPYDPQKKSVFLTTKTIPRVIKMGADEYIKTFNTFPVVGKEVDLISYFKARVTQVGEKDATLEFLAKDGARIEEGIGVTEVHVKGDEITTILQPKIEADFNANGMHGKIIAAEGGSFTVDNNNPMAGKPILLDLEVVSVTRAANLKTAPIDWIENNDAGLAEAKKEGKPLFLLLYADWCHWCQKTQTETLTDLRIGRFRDKFVWMKLNSDKEKKYKEQYGQNGYPMMVILRPDGSVLKKIDGYRDAGALKAELDGAI